jgi:hypothetical protein
MLAIRFFWWVFIAITEDEKKAIGNSMVGENIQIEQGNVKSGHPSTPKDQQIGFLCRMCLIIRR